MSLAELRSGEPMTDGAGHPPNWTGSSFFGLYPALVTDVVDPDRQARVEVRFPWLGEDAFLLSDLAAGITAEVMYVDAGFSQTAAAPPVAPTA